MKMYNANMFYRIFHGEFNIGFNRPSSDACNTCTLLSNQIKTETDARKKNRIHNTEACP